MLINQISAIVYPIIISALGIFLYYRLKPGRGNGARGGGMILAGLILVFLAALVNLLAHHPDYERWFIDAVYPILGAGELALAVSGIFMLVIGLVVYFSYLGDRDLEVANHLEKLRLLDNIQQDSRYPFPIMELLDRVLKGMVSGLDEEAGAVFLLNRTQKQFVLATGVGLSKEETALLEYYPWGRNIISQAIEEQTPVISADFRSLEGKAQLAVSKFRSILVIPLISGRSKLGAVLFFSQEKQHYSREFISIVAPIAEWLAEKIEVNRLGRDFHKVQSALDVKNEVLGNCINRLGRILKSDGEIPSPAEFAGKCVGLVGADEVWLVGLANGKLTFYGGTVAVPEFSDNFRTAIISALAQNKAVVLNQEATDEAGNSFIARASLLIPTDGRDKALLLRNNNGRIEISHEDFQVLELVALVGGMIINSAGARIISRVRSKGIKIINDLLQLKLSREHYAEDIRQFIPRLAETFSGHDFIIILFRRFQDGYKIAYTNTKIEDSDEFLLSIGEGSTGRTAALRTESGLFGSGNIAGNLTQYSEENRNRIQQLIGDRRLPAFQGDYPVVVEDRAELLLTVFGFDDSADMNGEYHRLLSLLAGLLNLRIGILNAGKIPVGADMAKSAGFPDEGQFGRFVDELAAISGHCQLARQDMNLTGSAASSVEAILEITERMAADLRPGSGNQKVIPAAVDRPSDINGILKDIFSANGISGNLHMIEGRPLALNLKLKDIPLVQVEHGELARLLDEAVVSFIGNVEEDEIVTISTYRDQSAIYVDISKHRENFPPVEAVVGFGNYLTPLAIPGTLREAAFIKRLARLSGQFAYDRFSRKASYYSLKLPFARRNGAEAGTEDTEPLTILAIDSQAVILDLLAAMCQSMGHKIHTARNGAEGLKLVEQHRPGVVIADLNIPDMTGWDLAGSIRTIAPGTPVIIVTGWGVAVDKKKMEASGVKFVLNKPFRLEQLSDLISKARFSGITD
nr:response regulator [candidate division Zixibacteria bacterium]